MTKGQKILITGAAGFVGRGLVDYFLAQGWQVSGVGKEPTCPENIPYQSVDLAVNAATAEAMVAKANPQVIVHCAGTKDVRWCEANPEAAMKINGQVTLWMAEAARKHAAKFVFLSTDLVFESVDGNYAENDSPSTNLIYGKSKAQGEAYTREAGAGAVVCRTGGVYGKNSPLFRWLEGELRAGKKVDAFTDVKNTPTYLPDLGRMLEGLITKNLTGTWHTCGKNSVSRFDWFTTFAAAMGLNADLIQPGKAAGRHRELFLAPNSSLNCEQTFRALGLQPRSIAEAFTHLKEHGGV